MRSLIPEIEIGKKYLWKSCPIEDCCPSCGINNGLRKHGRGDLEVYVIDSVSHFYQERPESEFPRCSHCGYIYTIEALEGWYFFEGTSFLSRLVANYGCAPYTQLHPIEGEE